MFFSLFIGKNDIKMLSKQLKEKRSFKKELTNNLVNTMKSNEIDCFDIANGKLCYSANKRFVKNYKIICYYFLFYMCFKYDNKSKKNQVYQPSTRT